MSRTQGEGWPRPRAVAEHAVLLEFGETIAPEIVAAVAAFDHRLAAKPFPGFVESIPAFASVMVIFDPLVTDHDAAIAALDALLAEPHTAADDAPPRVVEVELCYDGEDMAPDLPAVCEMKGLDPEAAIAAHLSGEYRVVMYGFAPGYAYMSGTPEAIAVPRKTQAVRGVPAGTVIIAAQMCIITTIDAPTGWWRIGRSPTQILRPHADPAFLFEPGDSVRFRRISRAQYDEKMREAAS